MMIVVVSSTVDKNDQVKWTAVVYSYKPRSAVVKGINTLNGLLLSIMSEERTSHGYFRPKKTNPSPL